MSPTRNIENILLWPVHTFDNAIHFEIYALLGLLGLGGAFILLIISMVQQTRREPRHPILTMIEVPALFLPFVIGLAGLDIEETFITLYILIYGLLSLGILITYFAPKRKPFHLAWIIPIITVFGYWNIFIFGTIVALM